MSHKAQNTRVLLEQKGPVAILTLNNPPLNLLSTEVKQELEDRFVALRANDAIRVVLVTGSGERAFCAGADLKEFPERIRLDKAGEVWDKGHRLLDLVRGLPQVLIAVLDGVAVGGGLEVALLCDIIFASEKAKVGFPEVRRGVMPGCGGIENIFHRVGYSAALEMLITGRIIDAREAAALGVIDHLAEDDVLTAALSMAQEIASQPGLAVRAIKETLVDYGNSPWSEVRAAGRERFRLLHHSHDCLEGVRAFFEKREPRFSHR